MGITERGAGVPHVIHVEERNGAPVDDYDGARSEDGKVWGTYFHGLFDHPVFRNAFLRDLKPDCRFEGGAGLEEHQRLYKERQYDLLAEHFEKFLDMPKLMKIPRSVSFLRPISPLFETGTVSILRKEGVRRRNR
jgi:adenosylcobyric acid synthase